MNKVYSKRCGLFIGFHGCDASVRDALLLNPQDIRVSTNKYDWLGSGFYVWENNYERALDWARNNRNIENPAVIGVTYELGNCLDLMDTDSINVVSDAYTLFERDTQQMGKVMPTNKDLPQDVYKDRLLRNLDCAVINYATRSTDIDYLSDIQKQGYSHIEPYDTVRGCFTEGGKLFNTEIYEKTHIQVCVRNLRSSSAGFHKAQRLKELHQRLLPTKRGSRFSNETLTLFTNAHNRATYYLLAIRMRYLCFLSVC